jgi:hypothetical protein
VSELTARLAIYGAIDRAVVAGDLAVQDAAVHVEPYGIEAIGSASAVGWYQALADLLGTAETDSELTTLAEPDHVAATAQLAENPPENAIDAEHRLRALFLARRLLTDPDAEADAAYLSALQHVVEFGREPGSVEDPEGATRRLVEMMDDRERFPDRAGYVALAAQAHADGLLSATTAALAAATCDESTAWFEVPGTGDVDVAAVVTSRVEVSAPDSPVSDLRLRFHPGRWPACLPTFWGAMDPLAPPPPNSPSPKNDPGSATFVYREHVGDQQNNSEWFHPVLEFWFEELWGGPATNRVVNGFAIHYGMANPLPAGQAQDPRILVDDGEMTVRRTNVANGTMTVVATTYKMLAMGSALPSAGLAIFACASGWADQAKALVTGCLLNP